MPKTDQTDSNCRKCGSVLTPGVADGLCSRCLVARALFPDDDEIPESEEIESSKAITSEKVDDAPIRFGDYELRGEIARGGMGVVYEARQVSLNRPVALKMILSAKLASEEDIQRFRVEAGAAAKLDHPGIVPVFETGEIDDQHFYAMGLVSGGSLIDIVNSASLDNERIAKLMQPIAAAVQYAHSRNIVHRDLKPANILIDDDGQPKIADFGLAKNLSEDNALTLTGQVMGSPGYMPPEQAEGKMQEVGPLADVYSLGAILYFLLTKRAPFQGGSTIETLQMVTNDNPVSPRELNPDADLDLTTICLKCLEKDPIKRYPSAGELADEFARYVSGRPIEARPVSGYERTLRWCLRNRLLAGLIATAVSTLIIGICMSSYFGLVARKNLIKANEALAVTDEARKEAESAKQVALDEQEATRKALAVSNIALAEAARREHNPFLLRRYLNEVPADLRNQEWDYLDQLSDTPFRRFALDDRSLIRFAHHIPGAPGQFVVHGSGGVYLLNAATGKFYYKLPTLNHHYGADAVSNDGTLFAGASRKDHCIELIDLTTRQRLTSWPTRGRPNFICFTPDHQLLFPVRSTTELRNALTGELIDSREGFIVGGVDPENGHIIGTIENRVVCVTTLNSEPLWEASHPVTSIQSLRKGPEPNQLTWLGSDGQVYIFDTKLKKTVTVINAQTMGHWASAEIGLGGNHLLTLGATRDQFSGTVWDIGSKYPIGSIAGFGHGEGHAYCPESGILVAAGEDLSIWKINAGREIVRRTNRSQSIVRNHRDQSVRYQTDDLLWSGSASFDDLTPGPSQGPAPTKTLWSPEGLNLVDSAPRAGIAILGKRHHRYIRVVSDVAGTPTFRDLRYNRRTTDFSISTDGKLFSVTDWKGRVSVIDIESNKTIFDLEVSDGSLYSQDERSRGITTLIADNTRVVAMYGLARKADNLRDIFVCCDIAGGQKIEKELPYIVRDVEASPDSNYFAFACGDKRIRVFDSHTLELINEFRAHDSEVTAVRFHPRLPIIATGSDDLKVRLWHWPDARLIDSQMGPTLFPQSLDFNPSGTNLACASDDGILRIWDVKEAIDSFFTKPDGDFIKAPVKIIPDDGWVDVTATIDPARDRIIGTWENDLHAIVNVAEKSFTRLRLPWRVEGSYELRSRLVQSQVEGFKRPNFIGWRLPLGDRAVGLRLQEYQQAGALHGFLSLDTHTRPAAETPFIVDDQLQELLIRVVRDKDKVELVAQIDGEVTSQWSGSIDQIPEISSNYFGSGEKGDLHFIVRKGSIQSYQFELRMLDGQAEFSAPAS
ncbi:MAG: WD40 repeat domain-containing serine/threonine-protein kinase [Verrucomicrobiales bacterium]|nr:WD40 repeat domain-containing serine/threonine-protein kinase [Verrucomicrobiales bacterium]